MAISIILSKLLGQSTYKYILRILTTILCTSLSLNVFTLIRSIANLFLWKDKIFVCKFFTIYYVVAVYKEELCAEFKETKDKQYKYQ